MPSKNKSKGKNASQNKKRPKSVLPKTTQKQSDTTKIIFNKKNKNLSNKTNIKNNYISNKCNNFLSSLQEINSINNELDFLSSNLNIKFNNYHKNLVLKNYNSNNCSENKSNYNINSYFYDNKKSKEYNTSNNTNSKIKPMDNLYLYKQKNNSFKIYRQPELIKSHINNTFKNNSLLNLKYSKIKPKLNSYRIRNVFLPSFPYFIKKKKFNINFINNACKILLEKD